MKTISKTEAVIRRIAEEKIKAFGLKCSVDEYIKRCTIQKK